MMTRKQKVFPFVILFIFVLGTFACPGVSHAGLFLYEVEVLDKSAIRQLPDSELLDRYIDALIEIEASSTFHNSAGFNPKDYRSYKRILHYRADLIQEILRRELELPQVKP